MPAIQLDAASAIRLSLRVVQFVSSLIALATIAAGFRSITAAEFGFFGLSARLGSHTTNFGMLLSYTTMLYSLYQILAVEFFRLVPPPQRLVALGVDAVLAVLLLVGGIVLATSDYVKNCDSYGLALRCNNLTAGTVFVFIACGGFICTAVLTFLGKLNSGAAADAEAGEPIPYVEETTPRPLSPMGGGPSPSTKV